MSNRGILNNKMPYIDQMSSTEDVVNYIVKNLNSSYLKDTSKVSNQQTSQLLNLGVPISQSWTGTGTAFQTTFTLNHNLNAIPSGFLIIDNQISSGPTAAGDTINIFRVSWTTTQITVRLTGVFSSAGPFNGTFKILVLR